ncbi:MAG: DUF1015 family protein [Actinomycetota bacterium]
MPRVAPFSALVFEPSVAGPLDRLTSPPYDVINAAREREYRDASPHNIVHVDLAETPADPSGGDRYDRAAALLGTWRSEGIVRRTEPSYFVYELGFTLEGRPGRVRGLFCAMDLEPWGGSVLPHEETMPGPVEDRLRLLRATRTHLSAIYGTVAGPCAALASALDRAAAGIPDADIVDEEGVRHRLWTLPDDGSIVSMLADEPLLIADGHHRYTTALAYRDERHAAEGPGPWDRILTFVVDAGTEQVPVLPYHRIQLTGEPLPGGGDVADLAAVLDAVDDDELRIGTATRAADGGVRYAIHAIAGTPPAVRALHDDYLDGAAPGDALWFTHDALDADDAVRAGGASAAYFLPSTVPARIRAVIEAGQRLPRKSTFFWPKPRTGLVLMPLD